MKAPYLGEVQTGQGPQKQLLPEIQSQHLAALVGLGYSQLDPTSTGPRGSVISHSEFTLRTPTHPTFFITNEKEAMILNWWVSYVAIGFDTFMMFEAFGFTWERTPLCRKSTRYLRGCLLWRALSRISDLFFVFCPSLSLCNTS